MKKFYFGFILLFFSLPNVFALADFSYENIYVKSNSAKAVSCNYALSESAPFYNNSNFRAILNCPNNITINTDGGFCEAIVNYTRPTSDSVLNEIVLVTGFEPGTSFPIGITNVEFEERVIIDGSVLNNCSFTVTVNDTEAPTVVGLPSNINVSNDNGVCGATVTWTAPTADDNCSGSTIAQTAGPTSGSVFPIGTTTITYIATDTATNNSAPASFTVTVNDTEAPTVVGLPSNINVSNDNGVCGATVTWTAPTADDNCSGSTIAQTVGPTSGSVFPIGTTTITYVATDTATNNSAPASFTVTVNDTEAPTVVGLPSNINVSNDNGVCGATVTWTAPTADDNCSGSTIAQTAGPTSGSVFPIGTTTITYIATDTATNNSAPASFTITVNDTEAPTVVGLPSNINVSNDNGVCGATVTWTAPTADDNCSGSTIAQTVGPTSGSVFPIGTTTITYVATDTATNNSAPASFTVTVNDTEAPTVVGLPSNINVSNDNGVCGATVTWTAPTADDNCSGSTIAQTAGPTSGSVFPIGTTTITYIATDTATNNSAPASFTITVNDTEAPTVVGLPSNINVSNDNGVCGATVTWTAPTADDNCSGSTIAQTVGPTSGSVFPIGTTTITYVATDTATNNSAPASFTVTVNDTEAPTVVGLPSNINVSNDNGVCGATVTWTAPTADDNCSGSTIAQTVGPTSGSVFPIGTTTITYVATDTATNNSAPASFTVTVNDTEAPTVVGLPSNINVSNDNGVCGATVTWTAPTADDNCSGSTIAQTAGPTSGSVFPIGTTTITYVATDTATNNSAPANFTVTVNDTEAPTVVGLPSNINVSNDNGVCGATVTWTAPTADDNCSGSTIAQTVGPTSGSVFPIGTTTITYIATDTATNNSAPASFTVTVNDTEAPTVVGLPSNINVSNDNGVCGATVTWTAPTADDNCSGSTIAQTAGPTSGSVFPIGTTTITYVATDTATNNSAPASFTVTVNDTEAPTVVGLPSNINVSNDNGVCGATVTWTAPTADDNCSGSTIAQTVGPTSGSVFPIGTTTITYVATDTATNNSAPASFTVTVNDTEAPTVVGLPSNINVSNDNGVCGATVTWTAPTADDNCSGSTIAQTVGPTSGSVFPIGTTTITYIATDTATNNSAPANFTVTVNDTEAPTVVGLPSNINVSNDNGVCGATVTWTAPTADDNCSGSTIAQTVGPTSGSVFPIGTTTITYVATDAATNNSAPASFTVTVNDTEAPTVVGLPSNINVSNDNGVCGATVTWTAPTADDNCSGSTIAQTVGPTSGSVFPIGTTTITYVATDTATNNSAPASFTVTVNDTEAPTVVGLPSNINVSNDNGVCGATVTWTAPTADDNCSGSTIAQTAGPTSGSVFPIGTTTITYVATDTATNNSAPASFTVTVNDTEAPTVVGLPSNINVSNDNGVCGATVTWTAPTADDNCSGSTIAQTVGPTSGSVFPIGTTTITYVATDTATNNSAPASFTVTVNDTEAPTVVGLPSNINVSNDNGVCGATVTWTAPTADDNCSGSTIAQTAGPTSGSVFPIGTTTITYIATDTATNNSAPASFTITVNDTEAPTVVGLPSNINVSNDNGVCGATVTWTAPTADDNCSGSTIAQTAGPTSGSVFPIGTTTITYIATDTATNNSAPASFTITVNDTEAPTVVGLPSNINVSNDNGVCGATVTWTAPTADDNCSGSTIAQTVGPTSGSVFPIGTTTITYVATDTATNNSAPASFTVTVNDTEAPTVVGLPSNINVSNDNGVCGATVTWTAPTADDNCSGSTIAQTAGPTSGSVFPIGTTTITYIATDTATNNSAPASFTITVNDTEAPTVVGLPSNINVSNDNGVCGATVTWTAPTADDNCSGSTIAQTVGPTSGSVFPIGTTTITYVATDTATNNSAPASFTVTVNDTEAPTVVGLPSNINVSNDNGVCGATVTWTAPTADDNCSGSTIAQTAGPTSGSVFPIGTTTITYIATDTATNNSAPASFTITVNDTEAPTITCPLTTLTANTSDDGTGNCSTAVNVPTPGFNDNCSTTLTWSTTGATTMSGNGGVGSRIFNIGTTTINYTVTDGAGLTAMCSQDIIVSDDENPTISCPPNQNVTYDANCEFILQDYTSMATSTDNCDASVTITQSPSPGSVISGAVTVTLTATDDAGRTNTCDFDVIPSDITDPIASCQDYTVNLAPNGTINVAAVNLDNGSSDNCGIANMTISPSSFTCADVGANTVTFTVFDGAGNSDSCTAVINVLDVTPPTMLCNNFVVVIDAITREATISPSDIDNGSNDACGNVILTLSQDTFPESANGLVYTQNVILYGEDIYGNTSQCNAIVTVEPPKNVFAVVTGQIIYADPTDPNNPDIVPPSSLIEATACPGGITEPRDVAFNLSEVSPYVLDTNNIIGWEYSQDNGETWINVPNFASSVGSTTYTFTGLTQDTFVRVRIQDVIDGQTIIRTSAEAFVRFLPPDEPPVIISNTALDICLGDDVTILAESYFDQPNGQFGEGGEFNQANPDGWLVDGLINNLPANGDNGSEDTWAETNSNNNAVFSGINYDTTDNTKFALAHGVGNTTTMETPVFSTIGMTASEAILQFDTSFYFCNEGFGTIELSFDSGNTYSEVLTAYTDTSYSTAFDFSSTSTTTSTTGVILAKGPPGNKCMGQASPRMTTAYINLGQWTGESGLRVKFTFNGSTSSCGIVDETTFDNPNNENCNGNNQNREYASGWAVDAVGFAYAQVDDELEWTDEDGNVVAIGTTATVTPVTPGVREYGVTTLVNGCRADNLDGTNFVNVNTSLAYAGQDYVPLPSNCGESTLKLNAYDNTRTAVENFDKGAFETNLYTVPDIAAGDTNYAGTGVTGLWSITNSTTTACGNSGVFSSNTDPDAIFTGNPGTYTLRWTLQDGSGCFDEITVTLSNCSTVNFDGNNDYIDFKDNYNLNNTFSYEAWIKPNSVSGTGTVFSRKDDDDNTNGYELTIVNGQVQFNWYNSIDSNSVTSGSHTIGTDRWYHIAVTFDGAEYILYVDGIELGTQSGSAPATSSIEISALLGAVDRLPVNAAPRNHYNGWMDEVRIWNRALSIRHIRQMMNQRIEASGNDVRGVTIPTKIYGLDVDADGIEDDALLWANLDGYYRMNTTCGDLSPYKGVSGRLINIQTSQQQTAPLPYTSRISGQNWATDNTWTNFNVWDVPNSSGIDGTPIDWNIVVTNHDITSDTKDLKLLGLIVMTDELTISGTGANDETNAGTALWISDYLMLNGEIDLVGESQLVQKRYTVEQFNESVLATSSGGSLERDQQGTTNLFNYNYWSSPVGAINNTANNVDFAVSSILMDGTTSSNPNTIQWTNSPNAVGSTSPITLSNRWLYVYENYTANSYASWRYVGDGATLSPGLGYTMKGSGVGSPDVPDGVITGGSQNNGIQNYVFRGKPNNEDIFIDINAGFQALVGNPYPSALDSHEFIDDNIPAAFGGNPDAQPSTEGALYFWEHYTQNQTHILSEYQGGYAILTKAGGVPIYIPAGISGAGASSKTPGRYIPVGQGFFVSNINQEYVDSQVKFENDQRVFQRETSGNSVFMRNSTPNSLETTNDETDISRIRINFTSISDGKVRPLLLAFTSDNSATDAVDYGWDGSLQHYEYNDAFFLIEDGFYAIQGVGEFDEDKVYPLAFYLSEPGEIKFNLEDLENFENDVEVFIYDSLLGTYTKLNDNDFTMQMPADYFGNRFFLTFKGENSSLSDEDFNLNEAYIAYLNKFNDIYIKVPNQTVTNIELTSMLGRRLNQWNTNLNDFQNGSVYRIPVKDVPPTGTYILTVTTEIESYSKKVIIR